MAKGPCFPRQVSRHQLDKALTPDRVARIWRYAKENYIDHGIPFDQTLDAMAQVTGMPKEWIAYAFNKPKALRPISRQILKHQDLRKYAIRQADDYVKLADQPRAIKLVGVATSLPRRILTLGHGPVFPITHAFGLAFRPTAWKAYFTGVHDAWHFANRADHAAGMQWLEGRQMYPMARKAGLIVDPAEGPKGVLIGGAWNWSRRAWDAIKITRQMLFEQEFDKLPSHWLFGREFRDLSPNEQLETAKVIAETVNHSTGVMSPMERGFSASLSRVGGQFAPQLTASKIAKTIEDPLATMSTGLQLSAETIRRMVKGGEGQLPFAQRYAAYMRTRNAAEYLAFKYGLLAANAGLLAWAKSKDRVNTTDPLQSDWMRFKFAGHSLNERGSEEVLRLLGKLVAISRAKPQQLRGTKPMDKAREAISEYGQYKLDPGITQAAELLYGQNVMGRPLPKEIQWLRDKVGLHGSPKATRFGPQLTLGEYAGSKLPIYLGGANGEVYDVLRERGIPAQNAVQLIRALDRHPDVALEGATAAASEFIGLGIRKEHKHPTPTP